MLASKEPRFTTKQTRTAGVVVERPATLCASLLTTVSDSDTVCEQMRITIDFQSPVSLDDQIRGQLRELIATGVLGEGQALPSVRQLAADLQVHFNTVARAYRGLQDEGLLVVGPGRGVLVKTRIAHTRKPPRESRDALAARLRSIFVDARLIGYSVDQMRELIQRELDGFARKEKTS